MPTLTLTTNVAVTDKETFVKNFSKLAADVLKKPEEYIMVNWTHNPMLIFKGSFEPTFFLHVYSLGNLSPDLNEGYSKSFFSHLRKELGINDDRGYIVFEDPGNGFYGYKSTTYEAILRK